MHIMPLNKQYLQYGEKVFDWYLKFGLEPYHTFLDVGCCTLAPGIYFIDYLDKNKYFGFDKEPHAIAIAQKELHKRNLKDKCPTIWNTLDFDLTNIKDTKIDYVLAYSVVTHMKLGHVEDLLIQLEDVCHAGSKCILTFHENPDIKTYTLSGKHPQRRQGEEYARVEYNPNILKDLCEHYNYNVTAHESAPTDTEKKHKYLEITKNE